jgi:hypothetical protein
MNMQYYYDREHKLLRLSARVVFQDLYLPGSHWSPNLCLGFSERSDARNVKISGNNCCSQAAHTRLILWLMADPSFPQKKPVLKVYEHIRSVRLAVMILKYHTLLVHAPAELRVNAEAFRSNTNTMDHLLCLVPEICRTVHVVYSSVTSLLVPELKRCDRVGPDRVSTEKRNTQRNL